MTFPAPYPSFNPTPTNPTPSHHCRQACYEVPGTSNRVHITAYGIRSQIAYLRDLQELRTHPTPRICHNFAIRFEKSVQKSI